MRQANTVSQTTMPVLDLRRMPAGPDAGDAFLGQQLPASHHPQWEFWRASGRARAGRFASKARHLVVIMLEGGLTLQDRTDLCAGFQAAVVDVLAAKSARALDAYLDAAPSEPAFAVAGGVAANRAIRAALERVAADRGVRFLAPPLALCTDNAAMIAWAGIERFRLGHVDDLALAARPRWPLDSQSAPMLGAGKKGAKA